MTLDSPAGLQRAMVSTILPFLVSSSLKYSVLISLMSFPRTRRLAAAPFLLYTMPIWKLLVWYSGCKRSWIPIPLFAAYDKKVDFSEWMEIQRPGSPSWLPAISRSHAAHSCFTSGQLVTSPCNPGAGITNAFRWPCNSKTLSNLKPR